MERSKNWSTTTKRRRPQAVLSWFSSANFVAPRLQKIPIEFYTFGKGQFFVQIIQNPTYVFKYIEPPNDPKIFLFAEECVAC